MNHGMSLTSGSVYKEYTFNKDWKIIDCPYAKWQRVTDPHAFHPGARAYLPNPVNEIRIDDFEGAIAAEVGIEMWGGHAGTSKKQIRINGGNWINIPESALMVPKPAEQYQYFRYPQLPIELGDLRKGVNTFELNAGPQVAYDFGWGQWGIYGVTFRLYYEQDKAGLDVELSGPDFQNRDLDRHNQTRQLELEAKTNIKKGSIDYVDFLAYWEDFDHQGDGAYLDWHYRRRYGRLADHLGTVSSYPHRLQKDLSWLPAQNKLIKFIAICTDYEGLKKVSSQVEVQPEEFPRQLVEGCIMRKPYGVPGSWQTRDNNRHACHWDIECGLSEIEDARIVLATWNGYECDEIAINNHPIAGKVGRDHDFFLNELSVPVEYLLKGKNTCTTFSKTKAHGIEVLWPGPVLKIKSKGNKPTRRSL